MTWIRKSWFWLAGLLAVAAIIGMACGDDDNGATKTPAGTATAAATTKPAQVKTDVGVSATEIKIGISIVQSVSPAAASYQPILPTLQAYFKKVNTENKGVCGRQITLVAEDDQYSPALGLEKAKKLIEQDKVAAFMGNLGTPPNTNSAPYINEQKVPDLWLATGVPAFADASTLPYTTLLNPDYISEGKILGKYVKDNFPGKSVAVLFQNDDFGKSGRAGFLSGWGGTFTAEQSYESTATDVNSQLANLRASNPDILYLYTTPTPTVKAFLYMKANNWTPQVVESYVNPATTIGVSVGRALLNKPDAAPAEALTAGGPVIAGTISTNYILDPIGDKDNPAIVAHAALMQKYGGPAVGSLTVYAQMQAEVDVKTLQVACDSGDLTRKGIMNAAESLKDFRSDLMLPGITITTSKTDHAALQALMPVSIQPTGLLKALADKPIAAQ